LEQLKVDSVCSNIPKIVTHACQKERQKKIQEIMREPAEPPKEAADGANALGQQRTKQDMVREVMADTKLTPQVP
jgi:hypothetical protein